MLVLSAPVIVAGALFYCGVFVSQIGDRVVIVVNTILSFIFTVFILLP